MGNFSSLIEAELQIIHSLRRWTHTFDFRSRMFLTIWTHVTFHTSPECILAFTGGMQACFKGRISTTQFIRLPSRTTQIITPGTLFRRHKKFFR
jgi:hypothetical protein